MPDDITIEFYVDGAATMYRDYETNEHVVPKIVGNVVEDLVQSGTLVSGRR